MIILRYRIWMAGKALGEQNPSGAKYATLYMVHGIFRALSMATLPRSNYPTKRGSASCFLLRANLKVQLQKLQPGIFRISDCDSWQDGQHLYGPMEMPSVMKIIQSVHIDQWRKDLRRSSARKVSSPQANNSKHSARPHFRAVGLKLLKDFPSSPA